MKILLAVDGSVYSDMSTKTLKALQLPPGTEVIVMTVVPEHTFLGGITLHLLRSKAITEERVHGDQEQKAAQLLLEPHQMLKANGMKVETVVRWGIPAEQIIKQAHDMRADLIVIGAKGTSDSPRFPLGSVAQKVMKYADTSVLLIREGATAIRRVFLATDGSKYADAVARFLLDLPLPSQTQIITVSVLQSHMATMVKMPGFDLETNHNLLAELREAEDGAAQKLMPKTRRQFQEKGYDTVSLILRGEPAEEILMAAGTMHPEVIAVGTKGLTDIEAFLLGSVAQRVTRFSRYSVLVGRARVRKPTK